MSLVELVTLRAHPSHQPKQASQQEQPWRPPIVPGNNVNDRDDRLLPEQATESAPIPIAPPTTFAGTTANFGQPAGAVSFAWADPGESGFSLRSTGR